MKTIPKTVRSIMKKKEIKPIGEKSQQERREVSSMESTRIADKQEVKSHNQEKMKPSLEKSQPEPERITPIPSTRKPTKKPTQLPVVHLKKTFISPDSVPPEPQPIVQFTVFI